MSLGGVIGGAFNAFIAPLIFNIVVEYPAVLILSCLVHPWGRGRDQSVDVGGGGRRPRVRP